MRMIQGHSRAEDNEYSLALLDIILRSMGKGPFRRIDDVDVSGVKIADFQVGWPDEKSIHSDRHASYPSIE
jgi:hypothetical protein